MKNKRANDSKVHFFSSVSAQKGLLQPNKNLFCASSQPKPSAFLSLARAQRKKATTGEYIVPPLPRLCVKEGWAGRGGGVEETMCCVSRGKEVVLSRSLTTVARRDATRRDTTRRTHLNAHGRERSHRGGDRLVDPQDGGKNRASR